MPTYQPTPDVNLYQMDADLQQLEQFLQEYANIPPGQQSKSDPTFPTIASGLATVKAHRSYIAQVIQARKGNGV